MFFDGLTHIGFYIQFCLVAHMATLGNSGSFGGIDRLRRRRRKRLSNGYRNKTRTLYKKPVRYRFRRQLVVVGGISHQWQADIVNMSRLKRYNDDHTF